MNDQVKTWRRRRWISFVASILLLLGFVAILILSGVLSRASGKSHMAASLCLTPACVHAASELLYNLSPDYKNIDACTNFDQLACAGFNIHHDIPQDRSSYSTSTVMSENGQITLRHILESPYPRDSRHSYFSPKMLAASVIPTDEQNFNTMQTAYNSCLDEETLAKLGVQPLVELVRQVAGSFPVTPAEMEGDTLVTEKDHAALSETILLLEKLGVTTFEDLGTGADDKNPDVVIIQATPAGLTLPSPEYYQNKKIVGQYVDTMGKVLGSFLPRNASRKTASKLAQAVVDFETKIAAATPPTEDQQDVTKYYNIAKVSELGKIAPALGLDYVIKKLVPQDYSVDTLLLAFPEFTANVSRLVAQTPKSTVQSYLIWNTVNTYASYVKGPEVEPVSQFSNTLAGRDPDTKPERWKTCLAFTDNTVGWILSRFFVEAAFSESAKKFGNQIVSDIKQQFMSKLKGLSWMDDSVKSLAINKVRNIDQKVGFPTTSPNITDPDALAKWYRSMVITNSYFNNSLSSTAFSVHESWNSLGKPVDHGKWEMQADIINAYYSPVGNEIVFPAGIMQPPLFSDELPAYVSYGAFGSVSGHELSHAFDNSGRHFDENGNYTDWWTNATVAAFEERAKCFVDEYSNFTVEGNDGKPLHVNGRLTLGENIADAGGVAAAFAAWKERQQAMPDQDLPGLDYFSHEQLFHVFYAQFWCGKTRKEQAIRYIYTDPHSPAFARILGTMANSRSFLEAFSCPVKEPTCELW
jgi:endothelin-converting enzyme